MAGSAWLHPGAHCLQTGAACQRRKMKHNFLTIFSAVDLDRLPSTITPVRVKQQQGGVPAAGGDANTAPVPGPRRVSWEGVPPLPPSSVAEGGPGWGTRQQLMRGNGGAVPLAERQQQHHHHRTESQDLALQLPPKFLFTCTVGKSVLSKARYVVEPASQGTSLVGKRTCCGVPVALSHYGTLGALWTATAMGDKVVGGEVKGAWPSCIAAPLYCTGFGQACFTSGVMFQSNLHSPAVLTLLCRYCLSGSMEVGQLLQQLAVVDGIRPEQLQPFALPPSASFDDLYTQSP